MDTRLQQFQCTELSILLTKKNNEISEFEHIIEQEEYSSFYQILKAHDIVLNKIDGREKELDRELKQIEEDIKIDSECDKWDYIFASSAGVLAGLVDSFFVGSPRDSKWISSADNVMDSLVEKFAKLNGWKGAKGNSDSTRSAIAFLERTFKVNYDHRHSADVSGIFEMSASNHHLKSLAHSPSPIGLIFSIINQFKGTASFYDRGYLITLDSESNLQGSNFPSKLFAAFVNWIGHIMSDIAGSSGANLRGAGIPIPFYELLQGLHFGSFGEDKKTLAEIAVKVFEQGYDFRFGMVQSIPVVMVELFVRFFCIIRHRFEYNRDWKDCLQFLKFDSNARLRKMLLVGQGTLCLVDAGDAFVRSGGVNNWVEFFSRLNFVAWMRFSYLGLRHLTAILRNEVELQRYKLRAEAHDKYLTDVTQLADTFLREHNIKMDKYFLERKKEIEQLLSQLEQSISSKNYISVAHSVEKIGNLYGIQSKMGKFEDFNVLIDDDEY